ncbi:MAG: hypothetical protein IAF58_22065 [Leptolyngbya sp.]|nr:hypothetical protein [Candidatus Melainabacteria bacterium]
MQQVLLSLLRSLWGNASPRIDGLDSDCGGSDSDSGSGSGDSSDGNSSDCKSGDAGAFSSSAEIATDSSDCGSSSDRLSSSDRRARDAAIIGGVAAGAAVSRRKKGQRNEQNATDEDLRAIAPCNKPICLDGGQCKCGKGGGSRIRI